jgi:hypothetical protein
LTETIVAIHYGTDRGFPFDFDVRAQVVASRLYALAVRGQAEYSVTVHTPQVGFNHSLGTDAGMIGAHAQSRQHAFYKSFQPFDGK